MKKGASILKWMAVMSLNGVSYGAVTVLLLILKIFLPFIPWELIIGSLVITSWVMFPIAYILRKWVRNVKPFWYYFDDEDEYGAAYWLEQKGLDPDKFLTKYRWTAIRNPMWNMQASLVPVEGEEVFVSKKGRLIRDGQEIDLSNNATLFYVDENGKWTHNVGKYLSLRYSAIGTTSVWFTKKDKLYWRWSTTRNVFGDYYMEIHLGVSWRYTFRFKLKKVKVYEDL